jgi:hypothetical protein
MRRMAEVKKNLHDLLVSFNNKTDSAAIIHACDQRM